MTPVQLNSSTGSDIEAARQFTLWALKALHLEATPQADGSFIVELPPDARRTFDGVQRLRFCFEPSEAAIHRDQPGTPNARLVSSREMFAWLIDQLRKSEEPIHSVPLGQAESVHQLTSTLFEAFQVDEGRVQLAGCRLEDRPFLRLTFLSSESPNNGSSQRLSHFYFDETGKEVPQELRESLGMDQLEPATRRTGRINSAELDRWLATCQLPDANQRPDAGPLPDGRIDGCRSSGMISASVVWCKYAEGKLALRIGNHSVQSPFSGWAQLLAKGNQKPPPYPCPLSGLSSYHLAATDDGGIVPAEAIATCSESGSRVLRSELVTCELTNRCVLPEFIATCPVTGQQVNRAELVHCSVCQEPVSPAALELDRCAACRSLSSIDKHEPRMARILGEYPGLDRWSRWKVAETSTVYVLVASALFKKLLAIVEKNSLQMHHLATSGRFSRQWTQVPGPLWDEILR